MNTPQLKSTYYEQHRAERLDYQRRYKQTRDDKKITEDNSKYSRRESVMIMSFIKKSKIYIPSKIDTTVFVDTSSLTNFTHIPFTSIEYVKILAHVSPLIRNNKEIMKQSCRMCNMEKQPYMFGDNTDSSICDNCNFDTIDMCYDIVNSVIDNIILTKHQIRRKIINKKYRAKHSIPIAQKRFMKNKSKRLITDYKKYHMILYNDNVCMEVKPNDFRKIYMSMIN
jgi:hypothetical protein